MIVDFAYTTWDVWRTPRRGFADSLGSITRLASVYPDDKPYRFECEVCGPGTGWQGHSDTRAECIEKFAKHLSEVHGEE